MLTTKYERGQTIVLIAVMIFGLLVLSALVVDGGNLYMNRRAAQTAADSAALAGAMERCVNKGNLTDVTNVVNNYAMTQNDASAVENLAVTTYRVSVEVSITQPTFFARVFGLDQQQVNAAAAADCLIPRGVVGDIVPIAYTCRPPVGGEVEDCNMERIPYKLFQEIEDSGFDFETFILDVGDETTSASYMTDLDGLNGEGKALYIVMDTDKFDEFTDCSMYGGPINCDFNNDGIIDVAAGGDRGWLYLEGNASDLKNIMENGPVGEVYIDRWYPGKPGADDVVISTAHDYRVGDVVFVPIFDKICTTNDFFNECDYNSPPDTVWEWSGKYTYYRITEFAASYVSCVWDNNKDKCPGRDYAGLGKKDANTIEGYFLDGFVTGGSPDGNNDTGVYIISLVE